MPDEANSPSLFDDVPEEQTPLVKAAGRTSSGNYWDYCPNCGARLHNAGCKYRCPRCHYFMSCSDFD